MLTETLLIALFLLCLLHFYIRYGRTGLYLDRLPGPYAYPIIGNLPRVAGIHKSKIWPMVEDLCAKYNPLWRFWVFHYGGAVLMHPDDIEALLSSPKYIEKSIFYRLIEGWLETGLLTSKGSKWFHRRKTLTPAFHFNVLHKYVEIMSENAEKMIQALKIENKDVTINLNSFLTKYTLNVICETAMGTSLSDDNEGKTNKYKKAVYEIGEIAVHRFKNAWLLIDPIFKYFTSTGWKQQKIVRTLHEFSTQIINERKDYHNQTNGEFLREFDPTSEEKHETKLYPQFKKRRMAMLDILISSYQRNEIDDKGIREEVDTFIFEGHDTTAMALTFSLQLLAEYKDVQKRAREEVIRVWESCDGKIGINELNKMSYLERCIKEVLRLYPSVPFISRHLNEDLHLKNHTIPKGVTAVVLIYDLHHDHRVWPDPNKFDPDRFLPEQMTNRHPYSYIPFSAGPRNCIGQKFAMLELKMFCAHVLRNFNLEAIQLHKDFSRSPDIIIRPEKDIHVKFMPIIL